MSSANKQAERRKTAVIAVLMLTGIVLGGGVLAYVASQRSQKIAEEERASVAQLKKIPPPSQDFVGSAKCTECHAEIAAKYAKHPMGQSLQPIEAATTIEDYSADVDVAEDKRHYTVSKKDGAVRHHEFLPGEDGKPIYDQAEPIQYALGAGRLERNYLLERGGVLLQSPIAWDGKEKKFRFAKGYGEGNDSYHRFERRIGDSCLACHSGRANPVNAHANRYKSPVFHETAIGCERCHGPGKSHVERQTKSPTSGGAADDTIVNPARLDTQRGNHVCFQCHMRGLHRVPRYGASLWDFRPGKRLDDAYVILAPTPQSNEEFRLASHAQQMQGSTCFKKADGGMRCFTCHDPHSTPEPEKKVEFYNQRCASCHADRGCALPEPKRAAAPANGSCIYCHMPPVKGNDGPHTTRTNHRIPRTPNAAGAPSTIEMSPFRVGLFDNAEVRLPPRAAQRVRGLAMMADAVATRSPDLARKAGAMLVPEAVNIDKGIKDLGDDIPVLNAMGSVFALSKRPHEAAHVWDQILHYDPQHEKTLAWVVRTTFEARDPKITLDFANRLLAINPALTTVHARKALALEKLDRIDDAIKAAREALALNPSLLQLREWLVGVYKRAGDEAKAATEQKIVDALKKAGIE